MKCVLLHYQVSLLVCIRKDCRHMQFVSNAYLLCLTGGIALRDINNWKPDNDEESQSATVKSVYSVPGVQDPLGSSIMTPDDI